MDELREALTRVEKVYRLGGSLADYLAAERMLDGTNDDRMVRALSEHREVVVTLFEMCELQNQTLALLIQRIQAMQ